MKDLNYLISIPFNDNKINLISELKAAILKSYSIKDPSQAIHQIDLPEFKVSIPFMNWRLADIVI